MQGAEAGKADICFRNGPVDIGQHQQSQGGIEVALMHPHGEQEDRDYREGRQKGIFRLRIPASQAKQQCQRYGRGDCQGAEAPIGDAPEPIVLADPVQAQKAPQVAGVHRRVRVGAQGVQKLRHHLPRTEGEAEDDAPQGHGQALEQAVQELRQKGSSPASAPAPAAGQDPVYGAHQEHRPQEQHLRLDQEPQAKGDVRGIHPPAD